MMTHDWRGKFSGSYITFFSIPTGLTHAQAQAHCLLESHASVGPYKHAMLELSFTHTHTRAQSGTHTKT